MRTFSLIRNYRPSSLVLLLTLVGLTFTVVQSFKDQENDNNIIQRANSLHAKGRRPGHHGHWLAKKNKFHGLSKHEKNMSLGGQLAKPKIRSLNKTTKPLNSTIKPVQIRRQTLQIPDSFDARVNWQSCASISAIRDQGKCGSCWAHASAEVISDRICIQLGQSPKIAVQDQISCMPSSIFINQASTDLCQGGSPQDAFRMYTTVGLVTGGDSTEQSLGCMPYSVNAYKGIAQSTVSCTQSCTNGGYQTAYLQDKNFGDPSTMLIMGMDMDNYAQNYGAQAMNYTYSIDVNGYFASQNPPANTVEDLIKLEIMANGTVTANMMVYDDLFHYSTGVYEKLDTAQQQGGHSVKIVGWSNDGQVPYWIIANSWGTDWGEQGFFNILRGSNECNIENQIMSVAPATGNSVPTTTAADMAS